MAGVGGNPPPPPAEETTVTIADSKDRKIRDYATPGLNDLSSGILRPNIIAQHFELKPVMFQMIQAMGQFGGLPYEDPHSHLRSFLEMSDSFQLQDVSDEALRLKLFPFTLRDRAKAWLNSQPPNSISTWANLAEKFLQKYFPPTRNVKFRNDIILFQQGEDEAVSDAWERFKELLRKCPHHGIPHCIQLETFYNGLSNDAKIILDATAGGAFTAKTYNEGYQILEKVSNNNTEWSNPRANIPKTNSIDSDTLKAINAQLVALTKLVLNGNIGHVNSAVATPQLPESCSFCGEEHTFDYCPGNPEAVNLMGTQSRNNPFSQTYNPSWRNHPNFSWILNQGLQLPGVSQEQNRPQNPPGFHQPSHFHSGHSPQNFHSGQSPQKFQQKQQHALDTPSSLESLLKGFINQTQATMRNFETQLGQLAAEVKNRSPGTLPSHTENARVIGKGTEHVKSITLRSGKDLKDIVFESDDSPQNTTVTPTVGTPQVTVGTPMPTVRNEIPDLPTFGPIPRPKTTTSRPIPQQTQIDPRSIPFPEKLKAKSVDFQFKKILDIFKQLHINIPLVEALEQMPSYVKFLKDILNKKRKLGEFETVALTQECSSLITSKIPPKLKDPGSFTIPCTIGGQQVGQALCDLGASINLMPLSIFNKLGIGEARPTTVTLQLADQSIAYPKGKIEDVLVQVDKFIFPADFLILDYEADKDIPIILGRSFLATGRTLIDVHKGELTMRVHDQEVTFKVFKTPKFIETEDCFALSLIDGTPSFDTVSTVGSKSEHSNLEHDDTFEDECNEILAAFEQLDLKDRHVKLPSKHPPDLNLKSFPSHLEYVYLDELEELCHHSYINVKTNKENIKRWPDQNVTHGRFVEGQKVLLFNSRLRMFPEKLKSRWKEAYTVVKVSPFGTVELVSPQSGQTFKVNGQRFQHFLSDSAHSPSHSATHSS